VQYALSLGGLYLFAVIVDALAPRFGGQPSLVQATKVSVYTYTAVAVAGAFTLVPVLSFIVLPGALYSLYLLFLGLPRVMRAPADRALTYAGACVLVALALGFLVGKATGFLGLTPHVVPAGHSAIDIDRPDVPAAQ
jgi:hypothetical protein